MQIYIFPSVGTASDPEKSSSLSKFRVLSFDLIKPTSITATVPSAKAAKTML